MTEQEINDMIEQKTREKVAENIKLPLPKQKESLQANIVSEQQSKDIENYKESEDFKKASKELAERKVLGEFKKEALQVLDGDLKNQYQEYVLKKEKERLDYIMKNEKSLIKEQAKADLMEQKIKIAEQRYGYLYKREVIEDIDDEGNKTQKVIYKDFTPSKPLNVIKELASKYNNLSDSTRKIIWTTLKTLFWIGASALIIWLGYKGITALFNSGFIQFVK